MRAFRSFPFPFLLFCLLSCSLLGAPAQATCPDPFEPNNTCGSGPNLDLGVPRNGGLCTAGDVDYYTIPLVAGASYVIQTGKLGEGCDTKLDLSFLGCIITNYTNDNINGETLASRLEFIPETTALASLWVSMGPAGTYSDLATYNLTLVSLTAPPTPTPTPTPEGGGSCTDTTEPANASCANTALDLATAPATAAFCQVTDVDYFRFSANAIGNYRFETINQGSNCNPKMEIYYSNCATGVIAVDDNSDGDGRASIDLEIDATGSYFIRMSPVSTANTGADTEYTIRVVTLEIIATPTPTPNCTDTNEPNDSFLTGVDLSSGPITAAFCQTTDIDYYMLNGIQGYTYAVETYDLEANCDTILEVGGFGCSTIYGSNDDNGAGPGSRVEFTVGSSEVMCVRVSPKTTGFTGEDSGYTIAVTVLDGPTATPSFTPQPTPTPTPTCEDLNEPNNSCAEAPLMTTEVVSGTFCNEADVDYWLVDTQYGYTYTFTTEDPGLLANTVLTLYDAACDEVLATDQTPGLFGSRLEFTPGRQTTQVAIAVANNNPMAFGIAATYNLRLDVDGTETTQVVSLPRGWSTFGMKIESGITFLSDLADKAQEGGCSVTTMAMLRRNWQVYQPATRVLDRIVKPTDGILVYNAGEECQWEFPGVVIGETPEMSFVAGWNLFHLPYLAEPLTADQVLTLLRDSGVPVRHLGRLARIRGSMRWEFYMPDLGLFNFAVNEGDVLVLLTDRSATVAP